MELILLILVLAFVAVMLLEAVMVALGMAALFVCLIVQGVWETFRPPKRRRCTRESDEPCEECNPSCCEDPTTTSASCQRREP